MKNIPLVGNRSKNMPTKVQKAFLKDKKPGLYVNFWSISMLLDPDPLSKFMRIRILNQH
jgi:hypothetical protein